MGLFSSTSVVSPDCLVTFGGSGRATLVMSIGLETNIVAGSTHNLCSGGQPFKNFIQEDAIPEYLNKMNIEYIMDDYADQFQCSRAARRSSNQLELATQLFNAWEPSGSQRQPSCHNELLTNIHQDMVFGVLSWRDSDDCTAEVCKEFAEQFGKELKVIRSEGGLFVVQ